MQQENQNVIWTGSVDLTDGGANHASSRGFRWVLSSVATMLLETNSQSYLIRKQAQYLNWQQTILTLSAQWIRLGAVGPELRILSIDLSDDHVSPGASIEVNAKVINTGGQQLCPHSR